jgi:hypothetical protein
MLPMQSVLSDTFPCLIVDSESIAQDINAPPKTPCINRFFLAENKKSKRKHIDVNDHRNICRPQDRLGVPRTSAQGRLVRRPHDLDLSRFDAAPLIAFTATKEMNYGTETDGRIS